MRNEKIFQRHLCQFQTPRSPAQFQLPRIATPCNTIPGSRSEPEAGSGTPATGDHFESPTRERLLSLDPLVLPARVGRLAELLVPQLYVKVVGALRRCTQHRAEVLSVNSDPRIFTGMSIGCVEYSANRLVVVHDD